MRNRKLQIVAILLFSLYIGVFGILYAVLPRESFSEKEKRVLAAFPETSLKTVLDGSFESGFETWLSDHVPGRDTLVGINAEYEQISARNGLNGVIYAGGDRLYASADRLDAEDIRRKCARINAFAEATALPTDVLLIPDVGYIHEAELPLHAPYPDAELHRLMAESLDGGIGLIWPEALLSADSEQAQLYYRTDHHLTSRGSYEVCRLYAETAGRSLPDAAQYDVETCDGFYGSMYAKSGLWRVQPDTLEIWRSRALGQVSVCFDDREASDSLFFTEHLQEMDKYPVFLDGNHGLVVIDTGREGGESLLIVRDSFGHCFAPFAADAFDRVVLVDLRYYRKSVSALAQEMQVDRVLFLYGADTFITDGNFAWLK